MKEIDDLFYTFVTRMKVSLESVGLFNIDIHNDII